MQTSGSPKVGQLSGHQRVTLVHSGQLEPESFRVPRGQRFQLRRPPTWPNLTRDGRAAESVSGREVSVWLQSCTHGYSHTPPLPLFRLPSHPFSHSSPSTQRSPCSRCLLSSDLPFCVVSPPTVLSRTMPAVATASDAAIPRVFVIHENPVWLPPFAAAFDRLNLPWSEWDLSAMRTFDLSSPPPPGVFYNRMSASSHTRDHRYAAELTVSVLAWLRRYGRRVVNGPGAIDLEISKTRQYAALEAAGLRVPRTVLVQNIDDPEAVLSAARHFFPNQPLILKPNRGGKGQTLNKLDPADPLSASPSLLHHPPFPSP